jgi:ABC-type sugar transport system, ATPase component
MNYIENQKVILEGKQLSKQFYGNPVLKNVDIVCKEGMILALAGENGAGKSTLMNIICGNLQPDSGGIFYCGEKVNHLNPQKAQELKIAFVHQELSLLPDLSIGENIMLGQEPTNSLGLISHRKLHNLAKNLINELQYEIDVYKLVKELTLAEKQMVEIAKAWVNRPKIMILDEPTSSLSKAEVKHLFNMMLKLKGNGTSIIFISHRMDEIFQICDEVVVLKDGQLMKTEKVCNLTRDDLIRSMVGREITQTFPSRKSLGGSSRTILELENICLDHKLSHVNLTIAEGQIIGIGGLEGQGQRELARGLFGIEPFSDGRIRFGDKHVSINTPFDAIQHGIGFIPDDRKLEGLVLPLSIRENISLLTLNKITNHKIIIKAKENEEIAEGIKSLAIKSTSSEQEVHFLSGGNQQKVVFSKWMKMEPKLLILHEPTRGVDIQSKIEIYQLLRDLTNQGVSIMLISSDMLELIGLSDQIYVLYEGQISGKIDGKDATEEKIMTLSSGATLA